LRAHEGYDLDVRDRENMPKKVWATGGTRHNRQ